MRNHDDPSSPPVGSVLRTGPRGVLVVEATGEPVNPGTRLATKDGRAVGVVVDLIGPVARPFLVVAPPRPKKGRRRPQGDPGALVGETLYAR